MLARGRGSDDDLLRGRFAGATAVEGSALNLEDFSAAIGKVLDPVFQKFVPNSNDRELFMECLLADGFESCWSFGVQLKYCNYEYELFQTSLLRAS